MSNEVSSIAQNRAAMVNGGDMSALISLKSCRFVEIRGAAMRVRIRIELFPSYCILYLGAAYLVWSRVSVTVS